MSDLLPVQLNPEHLSPTETLGLLASRAFWLGGIVSAAVWAVLALLFIR